MSGTLRIAEDSGDNCAADVEARDGERAQRWWQRILRLGRRKHRRLRLCETLPLGERRFVALVECDESRFLIGGTTTAMVLLARLENGEPKRAGGRREIDECA